MKRTMEETEKLMYELLSDDNVVKASIRLKGEPGVIDVCQNMIDIENEAFADDVKHDKVVSDFEGSYDVVIAIDGEPEHHNVFGDRNAAELAYYTIWKKLMDEVNYGNKFDKGIRVGLSRCFYFPGVKD